MQVGRAPRAVVGAEETERAFITLWTVDWLFGAGCLIRSWVSEGWSVRER
jgi:hypothetical protein